MLALSLSSALSSMLSLNHMLRNFSSCNILWSCLLCHPTFSFWQNSANIFCAMKPPTSNSSLNLFFPVDLSFFSFNLPLFLLSVRAPSQRFINCGSKRHLAQPEHHLPSSPCPALPSACSSIFATCGRSHYPATWDPHIFAGIDRHLLGCAHHSIRCFFASPFFVHKKVHFSFGFGERASQSFHSSTRQWKLGAAWTSSLLC